MTRAITIYSSEHAGFSVHEGERHSGRLSWDEMVGQVAAMTLPIERCRPSGLFGMNTPDEWDEQAIRRRRNWVTVPDKQLGSMALEALRAFANEHGSHGGEFDELLPIDQQDDERVRLAMRLLELSKATVPA